MTDAVEERGYRIFISYSRRDGRFASSLDAKLKARGHLTRIDIADVTPGEAWKERIDGMIRESDVLLFVLSPDSLERWDSTESPSICAWEVRRGLQLGKRLVPVLWRRVPADRVPAEIASLNYVIVGEGSGDHDVWQAEAEHTLRGVELALNLHVLHWTRELTKWVSRALDWMTLGRVEGALLRSREISEVQAWLARRPTGSGDVPPLVDGFVEASLAKEESDRRELAWREQRIIDRTQRYFGSLARKASGEGKFESAIRLAIAGIPTKEERERGHGVQHFLAVQLRHAAQNSRLVYGASPAPEGAKCVSFSDDDRRVALLCRDGSIHVIPTTPGSEPASVILSAEPSVNGVGFSADGSQVFTYGDVGDCTFWATDGQKVTARLEHGGAIHQAGPMRGNFFFTAGVGGIKLWDLAERRAFHVYDPDFTPSEVRFSSQVNYVIYHDGDQARVCRLGEAAHFAMGYAERAMGGQEDIVRSVAITEAGQRFAVGCADEFAYVYDLSSGARQFELSHFTMRPGCTVTSMEFFSDGRLLLTGCNDGFVYVWDCATGQKVYQHAFEKIVLGVNLMRYDTLFNGPKVVVSTADGVLHYLEFTESGQVMDFVSMPTFDDRPTTVALSKGREELAALISPSGQFGIWKAPCRRVWDTPHIRSRHADGVFTEDSEMIRTCLPLRRDIRKLLAQPRWAGLVEPVASSFSRDSERRFTGIGARLGVIFAVSYDEKAVVTANSDRRVFIVEPSDGRELFDWQADREVVAVRLSSSRDFLLVWSARHVVSLCSVRDGRRLWSREIIPPGPNSSMLKFDVSSDDSLFTVASGHLVQVRRMVDGELVCEFDRVLDWVRNNNFLPGTLLVASSGHKGSMFVWDAESGQLIETFSVPDATPFALSSDRSWFLSTSKGGFSGWRSPWLLLGGPLGLARSVVERKLFGLKDEGGSETVEIAALGLDDGSLEAKAIAPQEVESEDRAIARWSTIAQSHYQL